MDMIEKVARAIEAAMFAPHELPLPADLHQKYLVAARAAIEATQIERLRADNRILHDLITNDAALIERYNAAVAARIRAALTTTEGR